MALQAARARCPVFALPMLFGIVWVLAHDLHCGALLLLLGLAPFNKNGPAANFALAAR